MSDIWFVIMVVLIILTALSLTVAWGISNAFFVAGPYDTLCILTQDGLAFYADQGLDSSPTWRQIPGRFKQISVQGNKITGKTLDGKIYYNSDFKAYPAGGTSYSLQDFIVAPITTNTVFNKICTGDAPYALDTEGKIYKGSYQDPYSLSTKWTQKETIGRTMMDMSVFKDKRYMINQPDVYQGYDQTTISYNDELNNITNSFILSGIGMKSVSLSGSKVVYTDNVGNVYYSDSGLFTPSATLKQIAGTPKVQAVVKGNTVYAIDEDGTLQYAVADNKGGFSWIQLTTPYPAAQLS